MAALGVGLAVVGTFCSAVGYTLQKTAHNRAAKDLQAELNAQQTPTTAVAVAGRSLPPPPAKSGDGSAAEAAPDSAMDGAEKGGGVRPASAVAAGGEGEAGEAGEKAPEKAKSYWRYWQFPAGLGFLILGAVFAVFVFGLAGQSELAPMGAVTMIFNTILAWRFLGEAFTRIDLIATSLMAIGTTVAIAFGESSDEEYTLDELIALLDREVVWWVFGGEMFVIIVLLVFVHTVGSRPVAELKPWQAKLDSFGRPFIGGALSGYTGFLTKSSVEVAFSSVGNGDGDDWERWELYVFLVALGLCIFLQLKYMNSGLGRYDSMMIIPIYQSVLVIAAAVSGLVFFDELAVQNNTSITLFIVGCSITASGICVLLLKKRSSSEPDAVDSPAHEHHGGIVELSAALAGNGPAAAEALAAGDGEEAQADALHPRRWSQTSADMREAAAKAAQDAAPPSTPAKPTSPTSPETSATNPLSDAASPSHVRGSMSAV